MFRENIHLILFFCFALGLPLWAMENNAFKKSSVHSCSGSCYDEWKQETGGIVAVAAAQAKAKSEASPQELGKAAYVGCVACHGANGEGGIGPVLVGQSASDIYEKLVQYKNGETRGDQSSLMWSQSATLSDEDMNNIAAFVEAL